MDADFIGPFAVFTSGFTADTKLGEYGCWDCLIRSVLDERI